MDAKKYFEVFPAATLHKYPPAEWRRVFDFRQARGSFGPRPRLESWHGPEDYSYGVDGRATKPGVIKAALAHASKFAAGVTFNSCLAVLYRDGSDSVAWHADDETDMGPVVVSMSFGSTRRFSVRCNATREVTDFDLAHGDLLVMRAGAQEHFEHCIRKTAKPVGPRVSLTFRTLRGA